MTDTQPLHVLLEKIAAEITAGVNDPFFADRRGGLYPSVLWCETALNQGAWPEQKSAVELLLMECVRLINAVELQGWSESNLELSKLIVKKIRAAKW